MNVFESLNKGDLYGEDFFGFGVFGDAQEPKKPTAEPQTNQAEPETKTEPETEIETPSVSLTREENFVVEAEPTKASEVPNVPSESSIERATPRIEVPRTEPTAPRKHATEAPRIKSTAPRKHATEAPTSRSATPFERFLCTRQGRWINGVAWGLLAFLLAEGLTHVFGARAYYSLIYKCFVFPILSAVGAGLFYMFNRETDSVIERNVVTAIEVTALVVTLQGLVRLLWI